MQAILITAYKNKKNLLKLVKSFNDEMNIYIHIDKKSEELNENDFDKLNFKNLFVIKKYNVEWGSYSHLLAVIDLMNMAVMDDKNTFIHIISGEDYKLKSISYFNENFEDCDKIFCTVTECENLPKKLGKGILKEYLILIFTKIMKK